MNLKDTILDAVRRLDLDVVVEQVCMGLVYTYVQLANGGAGVAYNFPREECGLNIYDGPISGRKAGELVKYLGSENITASSLEIGRAHV